MPPHLMEARGFVDLLIPRGGKGLIRACVDSAKVPCIETGTGICHIYVDAAPPTCTRPLDIVYNAKTSRPSVCNAAEVCLVHRDVADRVPARVGTARLAGKQVELRLCPRSRGRHSRHARRASRTSTPNFWTTFWPSKVVDSVQDAAAHIAGPLHRPQRGHRHRRTAAAADAFCAAGWIRPPCM